MLKLRQDVFVIEQSCVYEDIDSKDKFSCHVFLWEQYAMSRDLLGYCRIVQPGVSYKEPSIGRVVMSSSHRKLGLGKELMSEALWQTLRLYPKQAVRISAQRYLERFYCSLGFQTVSNPYDEDGIPHIEMLLSLY